MMIALLAAGSGAILAGLAAILYGFLLDLSFGNTLILAGAFGVCSGVIVLAQAVVVRELKSIAAKLGPHLAAESRARRALAAAAAVEDSLSAAPESAPPGPPPRREEVTSRDRAREAPPVAPGIAPPPEVVEPTPASPKRRNLLFSSNVRKDREHPAERPFEARSSDAAPPPVPAVESAPAGFDDAWPRAERTRLSEASVLRRVLRAPSSPAEKGAAANATERAAPAARSEDPSPAASPAAAAAVTVVKSGVVDGMAYSLYSDGSIEAQMPEGMMHFTSIDELRAHLDQRQ